MENATLNTTSKDKAAIHRELAERAEHPGWMHHVADAATGKVLTTELRQPAWLVSRAQRLSQLGGQFDFSIFGTCRLTGLRRNTRTSPRQWDTSGSTGLSRYPA